jgi:eukaryotic-like serine/threonine-protein kinase
VPRGGLTEVAIAREELIGDLDSLIGAVFDGLSVEAVIGETPSGRIYRVVSLITRREHAIKVLHWFAAERPDELDRLHRETQALARLDHENVGVVLGSGITPDGRPYVGMELLRGSTLADAIAEGPMHPRRFAQIARQMSAGVSAAHEAGLLHRDLTPSSVVLLPGDRVKIVDFGVARLDRRPSSVSDEFSIAQKITQDPRYLAPEQVMSAGSATTSSDIYALGVIFYEMLSGRPPFSGSTSIVLQQQVDAQPAPLATQSGFEPLIYAMLQKNIHDRPPSASAVHEALELLDRTHELPPPLPRAGTNRKPLKSLKGRFGANAIQQPGPTRILGEQYFERRAKEIAEAKAGTRLEARWYRDPPVRSLPKARVSSSDAHGVAMLSPLIVILMCAVITAFALVSRA